MARIVELAAEVCAHAGATVGCELTRGATGRTTRSMDPEEVSDDLLVAEWSRAESVEAMLLHPGAVRFAELMRLQPQRALGTMQAYRGRPQNAITGDPEPSNFGPPPVARTTLYRYNEEGNPVLYLASTPAGVWAELTHRGPCPLFCQEFIVDLSSMRILDASCSTLHNFLQHAWDAAERLELREYMFSRALAKLVRAAGFEGMVVPGVRGTRDGRYCNLVVFEPEPHWQDWLAPGRAPFAIEAAPTVVG